MPRRKSSVSARRWSFGLCLAAVLAGHLLLLEQGRAAWREWIRSIVPSQPPRPLSVHVSVKPAGPPQSSDPIPLSDADSLGAAELELPTSTEAFAADRVVPDEAEERVSTHVGEPAYVPRSLLSAAPVAQRPVLLQWPSDGPARGSYRGVLKLFIDERGRVQRVEPDDEELPVSLVNVARQAFLAASFKPGEVQGRAVRSWIRIEVSFDAELLPLGPPATP
ncbi:hypothetical protein G8A07_06120 [Roseateles sp. DAIF2]|uniref:hypothetical protein n=1 Tax=Roseateles sp. DAIF2 TaxID=2714952 RepID=UPI0018A2F46E|nr:hypothetical protein [Roseateles sp. DAIF2]QPF72549.1 hypothetical protein G8A07_06120 [Roseateles sp. DAIF2]